MTTVILKYVEGRSEHEDYGRVIEYAHFKGNVQLRKNGDIVIVTNNQIKRIFNDGLLMELRRGNYKTKKRGGGKK